jgi:murein DD-endopeptidase MepM/ murein hydrolase activator NlpD
MSELVRAGLGRLVCIASLLAIAAASPAAAHTAGSAGGATFVEPEVTRLICKKAGAGGCPQNAELRMKGEGLTGMTSVVFLGKGGADDDMTAVPMETDEHAVVVRVPLDAASGRVRALAGDTKVDGPHLKVSRARVRTTATNGSGVFPVRAAHTYGDGLGAGRGHQGQDIFAKCGKRVVSALDGTVAHAKWQDRAGNYVVIKADDGTSQAYMHMAQPAIVKPGQRVSAGQQIGVVGDTGRATGCHLHFELWSAPGWYEGGSVMDPLPSLKAWDRVS